MSKKAFSPASKQPDPSHVEDNDPSVKVKKVSSGHRFTGKDGSAKTVGGASGPGYNFTGITPGSKRLKNSLAC